MTDQLYEFLKGKSLEFCYSGERPVLVNPYVNYEYLEEYAEYVKSNKLISNANKCLVSPHVHRESRHRKGKIK